MNALKLYRVTTLPLFEKEVQTRPVKRAKVQPEQQNTVIYTCEGCHSVVHLSVNDPVQCSRCDNRIVSKISSTTRRTYKAV